jgi:hypothetical protein
LTFPDFTFEGSHFTICGSICVHCELEPRSWRGVLVITLCDEVCQWFAESWWFSPVSPTNKTDSHDITGIKKVTVQLPVQTCNGTFSHVGTRRFYEWLELGMSKVV